MIFYNKQHLKKQILFFLKTIKPISENAQIIPKFSNKRLKNRNCSPNTKKNSLKKRKSSPVACATLESVVRLKSTSDLSVTKESLKKPLKSSINLSKRAKSKLQARKASMGVSVDSKE